MACHDSWRAPFSYFFTLARIRNRHFHSTVPDTDKSVRRSGWTPSSNVETTNPSKGNRMQNTYLKSVILCVFCSVVQVYAQRQAVFYVADPTALNVSEQLIVDRLGVLGFTVNVIDDNLSDPA